MSSPMEQKKIEKRTQDEPWGCPVFRYPAKKEQPRKEAELWTVKRRTLDCSVPKTYFFYFKFFFFYPTPATAGSFYRTPPTSSCQNGKLTESSLVQVNKLLLPFLAPPAPARSLLTLGSAAEEWRWWAGVLNLFIFNWRIAVQNCVGAVKHQHESAIGIHMSRLSWLSLPLTSPSHPRLLIMETFSHGVACAQQNTGEKSWLMLQ